MNRIAHYLTLTLLCVQYTAAYKTIILISTPRSLSTVFLRMMEARGDFTIFNEPGMATLYSQKNESVALDAVFTNQAPTFAQVQCTLQRAQQDGNVFVKEMYAAAREYLLDDTFLTSPDCHIVFIVRNPHSFAVSHYKKLFPLAGSLEKYWQLKSEFPDFANYVSLYHVYTHVAEHAVCKPHVIIAEDLVADPRGTITQLCNAIGIEMTERCLQWEAIDQHASCQELWHDSKSLEGIYAWHDRAMSSTGFGQLPRYKVDSHGNPTFEEIEDKELRAAYLWEYYQNALYYKKFCSIAQSNTINNK